MVHVGGGGRGGGGGVFLSAGLSNPCLSATDVGDAGAHFHCCSCIIKYPTTVRGGVPENAARFVVLHAFVRARARTTLCYRSAARFPRWGERWPAASESCLGSHLRDETVFFQASSRLCVETGAWWLNWSWGIKSCCDAKAKWGMPARRPPLEARRQKRWSKNDFD